MKNYKIDFAANTVTVTKTFLRTAQTDINSAEFKTLTQLREMGYHRRETCASPQEHPHGDLQADEGLHLLPG